jgi:hypothetical protein
MNDASTDLNRTSLTLGFWSALLCLATFLVFTVCFMVAFTMPPIFHWTTMQDYLAYSNPASQPFKSVAQLMMLFFAPCYVVLLSSLYDQAGAQEKPFARAALLMGVLFAGLISMHYFVQLSTVRLAVASGQAAGLDQFVQANPISAMSAINMLGWTLFFGLSSVLVAPLFAGRGLEKFIQVVFLINGVCCLLGGVGFVLDITPLVFLTINFGMGGAVIAITWALCVYFRRLMRATGTLASHG